MRLITLLLLVLALPAAADVLEIRNGLWETTVTSTNTLMPQPTTSTSTACVDIGEFDPQDMMESAEGCEVTKSSLDDSTLSFEMICLIEGSETRVKGHFASEGDAGSGEMAMHMTMGPMEMQVDTEWTSRYVGPCD